MTITQLGVLIEGTDCFIPFQYEVDDVEGVAGLTCKRIGQYKPDPNAIFNCTGREIRHGTVTWPADCLSLHPGPHHERGTARVQIEKGGAHVIVADFRSLDDFIKPIDVTIRVNAADIWRSVTGARFSTAIHLPAGSTVDFSVGVRPGDNYRDSTTAVRFAIFRAVALQKGGFRLVRVDDAVSRLGNVTARQWAQAVDPADAFEPPARPLAPTRAWLGAQARCYLSDSMQGLMAASFGRSLDDIVDWVLDAPENPPRTCYTHLFIPRSGSTVLMEMISKTQSLGYPHEFMEENLFMFFSILKYASNSNSKYFSFIRDRIQTSNGAFGIEIDVERLKYSDIALRKQIQQGAVVYQTRRNIVMQAISILFASPSGFNVDFDRALIITIISDLLKMMRDCEALFAEANIAPIRIVYEDLLANPAASIALVANALGVGVGDIPEIEMSSLNWKVMRTSKSWSYGHRVVTEGGAFLGYDVVECGAGLQAFLAGIDRAQLPSGEDDLFPLRFFAPDHDALQTKLEAAAAQFQAS